MNWFDTSEFCFQKGAHLLEIASQDEQDQLSILALTMGLSSFWIGLSDYWREGTWVWSFSDTPLDSDNLSDNWANNRPNDLPSNHDDCVLFERENNRFRWFDTDCLSKEFDEKKISQICQCQPGECLVNEDLTTPMSTTGGSTSSPTADESTTMASSTTSTSSSSTVSSITSTIQTSSTSTQPTTTIYTPSGCAEEDNLFNGFCFILSSSKATWVDAEQECQQYGGHLASVHSEEENTFLANSIILWDNVWLGGLTEGQGWEWSDKTDWDWSAWASGMPGTGNACAYFNYRKNNWYAYSCNYAFYFICQYKV